MSANVTNTSKSEFHIFCPFLAVQVSGSEYVEKGSPVQLICNATGKPDPPHDVEWFKNGMQITSDASNGILITKKIDAKVLISVLVINNSRMKDSGDYVCRSSNRDNGTIKVHILNGKYPSHENKDYNKCLVYSSNRTCGLT